MKDGKERRTGQERGERRVKGEGGGGALLVHENSLEVVQRFAVVL